MSTVVQPGHLVVLVHGLSDTLHAWDNCIEELRKMPEASGFLFHSSAVNGRFRTHHGFDRCGLRLADEIREVVRQNPQLKKLSVIGHSMGGMIARYALGILFSPAKGTVCGLRPAHFVTLATPHLGLAVDDGPAQVPFVAWAGEIPLLGKQVKSALQSIAHSVARSVFRGTGRHFLALDGGPGELPLLGLLGMDAPDKGQYFYSALRAFASRACYGNVAKDHWVSWENATVRGTVDLPYIAPDIVQRGRGVVREDSLTAGLSAEYRSRGAATGAAAGAADPRDTAGGAGGGSAPGDAAGLVPPGMVPVASVSAATTTAAPSPAGGGVPSEDCPAASAPLGSTTAAAGDPQGPHCGAGSTAAGALDVAGGTATPGSSRRPGDPPGVWSSEALLAAAAHPPPLAASRGVPPAPGAVAAGGEGQGSEVALEAALEGGIESPQQVTSFALTRLRLLPWRRVDVSFAGAAFGTAHNNIQYTRWTNRVGRGVLEHLRRHLQAMEELTSEQRPGQQAGPPATAAGDSGGQLPS